jgi:hypothetical protein
MLFQEKLSIEARCEDPTKDGREGLRLTDIVVVCCWQSCMSFGRNQNKGLFHHDFTYLQTRSVPLLHSIAHVHPLYLVA